MFVISTRQTQNSIVGQVSNFLPLFSKSQRARQFSDSKFCSANENTQKKSTISNIKKKHFSLFTPTFFKIPLSQVMPISFINFIKYFCKSSLFPFIINHHVCNFTITNINKKFSTLTFDENGYSTLNYYYNVSSSHLMFLFGKFPEFYN